VKLHLLRSCLGVYKIAYLLYCVPPDVVQPFLPRFDAFLHALAVLIVFAGVGCRIALGTRLLFLFIWVV